MKNLLNKLNYKGQSRIVVINAPGSVDFALSCSLNGVTIDREIDPRFPYEFMILFARDKTEVDNLAPLAVHNLVSDGILWFCFPKKSKGKPKTILDREQGWNSLTDSGMRGIRTTSIDEEWTAIRFRNIKYIKSMSRDSLQ